MPAPSLYKQLGLISASLQQSRHHRNLRSRQFANVILTNPTRTSRNQKESWDTEAEQALNKIRVLFRFRVQKFFALKAKISLLRE
jgi:hypothetical protein